jgi:hypothetical protein
MREFLYGSNIRRSDQRKIGVESQLIIICVVAVSFSGFLTCVVTPEQVFCRDKFGCNDLGY